MFFSKYVLSEIFFINIEQVTFNCSFILRKGGKVTIYKKKINNRRLYDIFIRYEMTNTPFVHKRDKSAKQTKKLKLVTLFRNKRFMLDEMFQRNASKFAILLEYENRIS